MYSRNPLSPPSLRSPATSIFNFGRIHRAFRPTSDALTFRPGPLGKLAVDVLLEILQFLNIDDILRLRRTNKHICHVTRMAVVWKRALRSLQVPIPYQTRPIRSLSSRETENLVIDALQLDINWLSGCPSPATSWFESYHKPYLLKILPGGRFMVVAAKDVVLQHWSVVVWDLNHPGGRLALAKFPTKSAIHGLFAKYMYLKGEDGIAIAYLRALPEQRTETCVVHISLRSLEELGRPSEYRGGPPFRLINTHKSRCQLGSLTLERGILAVAHRPRTILLINLPTKERSFIKLKPVLDTHRHSIWGIKILPDQQQVFVIRLIHTESDAFYAFELYTLPQWGETLDEPLPAQQHLFAETLAQSFAISDIYLRQPACDDPTPAERIANHNYAAPISIFAQTLKPRGVIHFLIEPTFQTAPDAEGNPSSNQVPTVVYNLPARKVSQYHFDEDDPQKASFLPGADRALWWTRPHESRSETPEMVNIFAYLSQPPPDKDLQLKSLDIPDDLYDKVREGTQSVTFDETSGRLCISSVVDSRIHVLDYAAY